MELVLEVESRKPSLKNWLILKVEQFY